MKKIGWLVLVAAGLGSLAYGFVYLARWEFHRALFVLFAFVATEVAFCTALLMRQLHRMEQDRRSGDRPRVDPLPQAKVDPHVLTRLQEHAPTRDPFAWMRPDPSQTNVFITMILGGGVIVSAGAWVIDRIASKTAGPAMETDLAARLGDLAFPADGFLVDEAEVLAQDLPYTEDPALRLLLGPEGGSR